jgi:RNA polymerase sigma-70 factor (ECF subfamily)
MPAGRQDALEAEVRRRVQQGELALAVELALEGYGAEILGLLVGLLQDREDARDVFSQFCEDVVAGLRGFQWRCSLRTWLYTVARHALARWRGDRHHDVARRVPLSSAPDVAALRDRPRSATDPWQRTSVKDEFTLLRSELDDDDQLLLILHVDRGLSFSDVALVMFGETPPSPEALVRETARLRKRFQLVKQTLRELAEARGLLRGRD